MFTVVWLVKKRPDLSQEEFTRYWIQEHTPLTAATPGMRAYRCYPMTTHDGPEPAFDAIAFGDLDGDGVRSTVSISGQVANRDGNLNLVVAPAVKQVRPEE